MRTARRIIGAIAGAALALAALSPGLAPTQTWAQTQTRDKLTFKDGKTVEGRIVEETSSQIRIKVVVAGIEAETTYSKSDILDIKHADAPEKKGDAKPAAAAPAAPKSEDMRASKDDPGAAASANKVYMIELTGIFGEDISETPIRNAVHEAKKLNADYVIFMIDNDWSMKRQGGIGEKKDEQGEFDQLFRSEGIEGTFTEEIQREWTKQPQVVFWVKKAMGGACFLPFNCKTIYFSSEGKMGGIGRIEKIFGSTGDKVVQEKQFALRLKHAEGRAIQGGYDPRIIPAMARTEYVLSYKMVGGKAVLLERMPESADEILLTDDGDEQAGRKDTDEQLARGEGDDVLTLTPKVAYDLGISKGTVDTAEDLLFQLGIARNHVMLKTQSEQIMKSWRDGLANARRQLPKLWQAFGEVAVKPPGQFQQRTQARGAKTKIINDMIGIERRYKEALNPHSVRVPNEGELEEFKKQIDLQQLGDKPEKR